MATDVPELVSRERAAEMLGVKPQTLACWHTRGQYGLPVVKIGRLAKYKLTDIAMFIEQRTRSRTAVEI